MPEKLKWCPVHKEWNWVWVKPQESNQESPEEFKRRRPDLAKRNLTDMLGGPLK